MGYLLEELRDGKNYEQFQRDIADANIFIGSLIFIEELAEKVSRQNRFNLHMLLSGWLANISMQMQRGVYSFRYARDCLLLEDVLHHVR